MNLEIKNGVIRSPEVFAVRMETPEHIAAFHEKYSGKLYRNSEGTWMTSLDGVPVDVGDWLVWYERLGTENGVGVYTDKAFHDEIELKS